MGEALTPSAFEPRGRRPPPFRGVGRRLWSVRNAALLSRVYEAFEAVLKGVAPLMAQIGFQRLERPVAFVERRIKGALFDCRMCGDCALSSTGLSCPMNCPKALRNGPCGGVRANGHCEIYPEMPCVWVQAYEGSLRMPGGARIAEIQAPIDHRLKGGSSWVRRMRQFAERPTT